MAKRPPKIPEEERCQRWSFHWDCPRQATFLVRMEPLMGQDRPEASRHFCGRCVDKMLSEDNPNWKVKSVRLLKRRK